MTGNDAGLPEGSSRVCCRAATIHHSTRGTDLKRGDEMRGIATALVLALLSTPCLAQSGPNAGQCDQIRDAIAQHGLQAARKHAMANHGLSATDIRNIEQSCGIGGGRAKKAKR